tara:strand:+ start:549 stop:1760 length:1212 start_codon:yes stop_codon:yes gene_type:complete
MVYVLKTVSILGSTGSVGKNTLEVISRLPDRFHVYAISCNQNISLLYEQVTKYKPKVAVITNHEKYNEFLNDYGHEISATKVLFGDEGLKEISSHDEVDIVVAAIVGFQCLKPTVDAICTNKTVIIANKEILVAAGEMLMSILSNSDAMLLPVDSEHNALLQVLLSSGLEYKINNKDYYESNINNLTITASGGPFIDLDISEFKNIKSKDAIKHPTWEMGEKISVDSSTMMNKGLEIIEAKLLFNLSLEKINAIIHRQSTVHALVEFFDGTVIAHMSDPDMKVPISYALTFPQRVYKSASSKFTYNDLTFEDIPISKFPCYKIARSVAEAGKNSGLILNAANEISVEYFLNDKIMYIDIPNIIEEVLNRVAITSMSDVGSILDNDTEVRMITKKLIKEKYGAS